MTRDSESSPVRMRRLPRAPTKALLMLVLLALLGWAVAQAQGVPTKRATPAAAAAKGPKEKKPTHAQRAAAAARAARDGLTRKTAATAQMAQPGEAPHYFSQPNYANSQLPTVEGAVISVGNPLSERGYATDNAADVFVVVRTALPDGFVQSFRTLNRRRQEEAARHRPARRSTRTSCGRRGRSISIRSSSTAAR